MIKFKTLFETVYEPRSGDEKHFKDKHLVVVTKHPVATEFQFKGSNPPKAKRKADYDEKEDESVYEAADVHTKRADKEAVIVRAVDPKTGQSRARVVQRRAGEIKIGEEVELEEGTVGHGKYTITTGPRMSGMGEGGPSHVVAKRAKMAKLGVPHHDEPGEYGHTVRVTVKNNDTNETTHHHVYQRDTDRGSKEALVSTRAIGTPRSAHKAHEKVLHNYLAGKKVSSLKEGVVIVTELGENLGKASKRMKFWFNTDPRDVKKRLKNSSPEFLKHIAAQTGKLGGPAELQRRLAKRMSEETGLNEADVKYVIKHKKTKQVLNTHDDYATAKDEHEGLGNEKSEYGVYKQTKKDAALRNRNTYREEVNQLDELSPNALYSYIKKAVPDVTARTMSAVSPNQSAETKKHASKLGKRIKGITSASGRLADRANAHRYEEVEMIEEAVKVGAMKLHDGSSIIVTREMADKFNNVLDQLNPMNRVKMEHKLHTSKKDFMEILKFAEAV